MQCAAKEVCQGNDESDAGKLERCQTSWEVFDRSPKGDAGDAGMSERKSASGGMMMMHRTVVKHVSENTGDACVEFGRSPNCAVITGAAEALGCSRC